MTSVWKEWEFNKKCDPAKLQRELLEAGFDIKGVSVDGDLTTVYLAPTETKNPTLIVEAHVSTLTIKEEIILKLEEMVWHTVNWRDGVLKKIAEQSGIDPSAISVPQLTENPQEILTSWIQHEYLQEQRWKALIEAVKKANPEIAEEETT